MPAAEDDDTLTAATATPQYDSEGNLKLDKLLTSTAISINQGGTWEPLDNFASIKDGTQVQVEIVYSVPANAFLDGGNTATYTLPAGVYPKGDLSGNITDSTGTIIGTFALSKNPLRSHLHLITTQVGRSPAPSSLIPRSITLRPVATARYIWARKPTPLSRSIR